MYVYIHIYINIILPSALLFICCPVGVIAAGRKQALTHLPRPHNDHHSKETSANTSTTTSTSVFTFTFTFAFLLRLGPLGVLWKRGLGSQNLFKKLTRPCFEYPKAGWPQTLRVGGLGFGVSGIGSFPSSLEDVKASKQGCKKGCCT